MIVDVRGTKIIFDNQADETRALVNLISSDVMGGFDLGGFKGG